MVNIVLSLGSNLGNRVAYIEKMETALEAFLESVLFKSTLMETEPLGVPDIQDWYINRVVTGKYDGDIQELFEETIKIEELLGRDKKNQLAARTADIDILLFDDSVISSDQLTIPHPGILKRRFCLEGLNQLVPGQVISGTGRTVRFFYEHMKPDVLAQKIRFLKQE